MQTKEVGEGRGGRIEQKMTGRKKKQHRIILKNLHQHQKET